MSTPMKKFLARHTLSLVRDGALKRIDPGQEVDLTEDEAKVCLEHGSVEVERDYDRLPSFAEYREEILKRIEAELPMRYHDMQQRWNESHGVVHTKAPGDDHPEPSALPAETLAADQQLAADQAAAAAASAEAAAAPKAEQPAAASPRAERASRSSRGSAASSGDAPKGE